MADPWFPLSMGASDPGAHLHTRSLNYSCSLAGIKAHSQHGCLPGELAQVRATLRHVFSPDLYRAGIRPDTRPHGDTASPAHELPKALAAPLRAFCCGLLSASQLDKHHLPSADLGGVPPPVQPSLVSGLVTDLLWPGCWSLPNIVTSSPE